MNKPNPNFTYLKENVPKSRYTLLQGSTRSGKTYATLYYILWMCNKYTGMEIDIVRDTFTALKATAWKDFKDILIKHGLYSTDHHNKTDKYYYLNGNVISYYGADDPGKIHGRSRDILFINEANHIDQDIIDQLFPRTRQKIIMDYNPALPAEHWLDVYIDDFPPLITTYKDNPFLNIEQIKDIERRKNNKYWWSIYGEGKRTTPTGLIFTDTSEEPFDDSLPFVYGMDFGYVNDPTTLVKVAVDKKRRKIYTKELLYSKELSTDNIASILDDIVGRKELIIADSAEPRLIGELQDQGFNIYGAKKGPDSIRLGLVKMMDYTICYESDDHNTKRELRSYVWNNKKSNVPIDRYNHIIDSVRYAFEDLVKDNNFIFL